MSNIEWTDVTWNPVTGCAKISAGCAHCYAADIANRFWGDRKFTDVQFHPERLEQPLRWRKPRMVFVNSMSDLFHESVTDDQLDQIFAVMALTPQHTYQVLTKRPERMLEYFQKFSERAKEWGGERWLIHEAAKDIVGEEELHNGKHQDQKMYDLPLPNVWLGVTVENQKAADERISLLLQTPAAVRFLSCEPLLEQVKLPVEYDSGEDMTEAEREGWGLPKHFINGIDWVIVGGESGPKARPCDIAWVRSIVNQCWYSQVPCFVKQLGSKPKLQVHKLQVHSCHQPPDNWTDFGSTGKGGNPDEWPEDLRVREFPKVPVLA